MQDYGSFLASKAQLAGSFGFEPLWLPDFLHPFQAHADEWAIRKGRGALYFDCGLGKTPMFLVWAENVVRHTNRPVLAVTTLGDSGQTIREAQKFGVEAVRSRDGKVPAGARVVVTNYEKLHLFDPADFSGMVANESSGIKDFDARRSAAVVEFMRTLPYRLLSTATAAPNDFIELGTSAEALGELGRMDMLARFFKSIDGSLHPHRTDLFSHRHKTGTWRFKKHAERDFWRWVCSWALACRKPSDLGFDDGPFVLPLLVTREHMVNANRPAPDRLFDVPAFTLAEQREEQRRTLVERCEKVAELVNHADPAVCWCHLNPEGDLLAKLIPGAVQVSGRDDDDAKEETFLAFATGQIRVLVTKPTVAGFGLNWQHCAHQTYFPSHSFEQFYQGVRRCWRFGQTRAVTVDVVTTEGSAGTLANLRRKQDQADHMFEHLVELMNDAAGVGRTKYGDMTPEVPTWLVAA